MQDMFFLTIIWSGVYLSHFFAARTQLTPVLYFLAFGSLMVNIGVLPEQSTEFIRGFSEIGIILIMFALGFEEDTQRFVKGIKRSWGIALFGALGPFCFAYTISFYFWQETRLALMCGLAMTATAVSLTMVSLKSEKLNKTAAATGIMTSAILDDIASLVAVAILVPLAVGGADLSAAATLIVIGKAVAFFLIIVLLELLIFPHNSQLDIFHRIPFLRNFGVKHFISFGDGSQSALAVLLIALLISMLAHEFGFHPAVGAYMAGLIVKQDYFHIPDSSNVDRFHQTREVVDSVAFSWIGPVFFVELGTKIVLDASILMNVIPQVALLTLGIFFVQILSAAIAARFTGSYYWHESILIGLGMLGRAELAFVVMDIGYVQNSIITTDAFYTLMVTAFMLNVAVPISIKIWKPYFEGKKLLKLRLAGRDIFLSKEC